MDHHRRPARGTRLIAAYFAAQAAITSVWWLALAISPSIRGLFELDAAHHAVLDAFLPADLGALVVGSAVTATAFARRSSRRRRMAAVVSGGFLYGALFMVGWLMHGGHGWLGLPPMAAGAIVSATFAADRPG